MCKMMKEDRIKESYKQTVKIHYTDLKNAIRECCSNSDVEDVSDEVNAYIFSTVGSLCAYFEKYCPELKKDDRILALHYVFNIFKHNIVVSELFANKDRGGISFPITFPVSFPAPSIKWKEQNAETRNKTQKEAYDKLFKGREVLFTLDPLVNIIVTTE